MLSLAVKKQIVLQPDADTTAQRHGDLIRGPLRSAHTTQRPMAFGWEIAEHYSKMQRVELGGRDVAQQDVEVERRAQQSLFRR